MGRVATTRSYRSCPLLEDFHIRNILGSGERRQIIFGSTEYVLTPWPFGPGPAFSQFTYSGLTGGLITEVDHSLIFAQKWASAPVNRTRIALKNTTVTDADGFTGQGFRLIGDLNAGYDIIVVATLPTSPRATPKWAKDYCPGCKNMDFWGIVGSIYKDVGLFTSRVQNGAGGTFAYTFRDNAVYGSAGDFYFPGDKGSEPSPAVHKMVDADYQVILFPSDTPPAAAPFTSAFSAEGFSIIGDVNEIFNVLIFGQIEN